MNFYSSLARYCTLESIFCSYYLAYVYCYLAFLSGLIGALRMPTYDRAPDFSPIEDMLILDDGLTDLYRE